MTLLMPSSAVGKGKGHTGTLNAQRVHEGLYKCHVIYGQPLKDT